MYTLNFKICFLLFLSIGTSSLVIAQKDSKQKASAQNTKKVEIKLLRQIMLWLSDSVR